MLSLPALPLRRRKSELETFALVFGVALLMGEVFKGLTFRHPRAWEAPGGVGHSSAPRGFLTVHCKAREAMAPGSCGEARRYITKNPRPQNATHSSICVRHAVHDRASRAHARSVSTAVPAR